MTGDKQSLNHKVFIAAIFAVLLIFIPPLMAATVNIELNDANQTIRGFGGMNFPRWIGTLTNDANRPDQSKSQSRAPPESQKKAR